MSNYRGSIQNRIGRPYKVEYVNRAGEHVNPTTGKPIYKPKLANNPYARPVSKENGLTTAKHRKFPIKRSGALFGGLKPIATDPTIDPPPHACFNCWQTGHKRTSCPRPLVNRYCNNCGRRNEDLRSCPRCREAHEQWLNMLQAKERGESVNEQLFMPDIDDDEIEEITDPDEILQDLIYQDQKTREFLENQRRKREQQETLDAIYNDRGAVMDSRGSYLTERMKEPYVDERQSYVNERELYGKERDPYENTRESYANKYVHERDPHIDGDRYTNEQDSFLNKRQSSHQERHIGKTVYKEREGYGQETEIEQSSAYTGYSDSGYRAREERVKMPEPPKIDGNWHKAMADASSVSNTSDPVQDILLLAKTISHLSPETQDLIMRQVIAERQEQTKRRAAAKEYQDSPW